METGRETAFLGAGGGGTAGPAPSVALCAPRPPAILVGVTALQLARR